MKKVISLMLLVCVPFFLASCENKDEVADEIVHYYNEEFLPMYETKEDKMEDKPSKLTQLEEENKKDEAITFVKDKVMPVVDESLERLEAADIPNKKVKKMNDMQIEAEQFAKDSFKELIAFYKGDDVSEQDVEQGNEEMEEKYLDVFDYREELMEQYNLVEEDDSEYPKLKRAEE